MRLVLLIVDPYLVYCYWEPPAGARGSAVLRFHGQSSESFDIEVDLQAGSCYVPLWGPEESLYAELLAKKGDEMLTSLARSQPVHLPRVRPVTTIEQHFMKVDAAEQRTELVSPPPAHVLHEEPFFEAGTPLLIQEARRVFKAPPDLTSIAEEHLSSGLSSWR